MDLHKDPVYLKSLLGEMDDCIKQLREWSVNNDDIATDSLALFTTQFDMIKTNIANYQADISVEVSPGIHMTSELFDEMKEKGI
jgi:hypothetical protein